MLSTKLKENTQTAHQQLEKIVVDKIRNIRSAADYAKFLLFFYSYFNALEKATEPFLDDRIITDLSQRRKAQRLGSDIETLGGNLEDLPEPRVPKINSAAAAIGAMYVMEGSVMGGPIIINMLKKAGIDKGFSFFSGYGEATGAMWAKFTSAINGYFQDQETIQQAIDSANETFSNFALVFQPQTPELFKSAL